MDSLSIITISIVCYRTSTTKQIIMNAAVIAVFLFALVAACSAEVSVQCPVPWRPFGSSAHFVSPQDDITAQIADITKSCAAAHKIAPEQLAALRTTTDKTAIAVTEDLKCFAKCAIEKSQFVRNGAVDVDRLVAASVAHGRDGAKVRANASKCPVAATIDCNAAWELYQCFHQ